MSFFISNKPTPRHLDPGSDTRLPAFVIAGAPKCGTTSLFQALKRHPGISMSYIKEPTYFATDLPGSRQVTEIEDYLALFKRARPGTLKGEASVLYLYSRTAIPDVLMMNPGAKFIALVRNPVDIYVSYHNELLKHLDEDQADPEKAWNLQQARADGNSIPVTCKERLLLQYRNVCAVGEQIQRLKRVAPEKQTHIVIFDDLVRDPDGCVRSVLSFLGIQPDPTSTLPRSNEFAQNRSIAVARALRWALLSPPLRNIRLRLKPIFNGYGLRPVEWIGERNLKKVPKPKISAEFRKKLTSAFEPEVALLERSLGRRFDHWLNGDEKILATQGAGHTKSLLAGIEWT